jgi:hypothetical protein
LFVLVTVFETGSKENGLIEVTPAHRGETLRLVSKGAVNCVIWLEKMAQLNDQASLRS